MTRATKLLHGVRELFTCSDEHVVALARPARTTIGMTRPKAPECQHKDVEYLGDNRDVRFLRCAGCGAVFVLQGGLAWALPAAARVASDEAAEDAGLDRKTG